MRAMRLHKAGGRHLDTDDVPIPEPGPGHIRVKVKACGVCRTDLHVVDGDLPDPKLPIVPGHEIVGTVDALGEGLDTPRPGTRVGIPWLGFSCGACDYCQRGQENLCPNARYTGYQIDGGYADFCLADARYCFALPDRYDDAEAAPLLCAGLIGHRAYRMTGNAKRLGIYGFGAAAHIMCQVACWEGKEVLAFTRPGEGDAQRFALQLGASWAGDSGMTPPVGLDAAIIFAPVGSLVPESLRHTIPGGIVVCAGIHMSDIPSFPYCILWQERAVKSVANLTRRDAEEFLALAPKVPVRTHTTRYPLVEANQALDDLRAGRVRGAAVLIP